MNITSFFLSRQTSYGRQPIYSYSRQKCQTRRWELYVLYVNAERKRLIKRMIVSVIFSWSPFIQLRASGLLASYSKKPVKCCISYASHGQDDFAGKLVPWESPLVPGELKRSSRPNTPWCSVFTLSIDLMWSAWAGHISVNPCRTIQRGDAAADPHEEVGADDPRPRSLSPQVK